jgi:hypothetical protein
MQRRDGLANLPDGLDERVLGATKSRVRDRLAGLLEVVTRREQVLQRLVVQSLGEGLALALLRFERVGEQL